MEDPAAPYHVPVLLSAVMAAADGEMPCLLTRGDGDAAGFEPILATQVLGRVVAHERGGRTLSLVDPLARRMQSMKIEAVQGRRLLRRIAGAGVERLARTGRRLRALLDEESPRPTRRTGD